MLGLTKGTRHYIQYSLTEGDGWSDLLFVDPTTSNVQGLWCSRSYSAANARIEELMAECMTDRSQYRIVRRTWDETVIEHKPELVASVDADEDEDGEDPSEGEYVDEDAAAEADLEAQVGEVPDTGDEPTEVVNPLVK